MELVNGGYEFASLNTCTLVAVASSDDRLPANFEVIPAPSIADDHFQIGVFSSKCDNRTDNPGIAEVLVVELPDAILIEAWVEPFDPPLFGCTQVGNEIFHDVVQDQPVGKREIRMA